MPYAIDLVRLATSALLAHARQDGRGRADLPRPPARLSQRAGGALADRARPQVPLAAPARGGVGGPAPGVLGQDPSRAAEAGAARISQAADEEPAAAATPRRGRRRARPAPAASDGHAGSPSPNGTAARWCARQRRWCHRAGPVRTPAARASCAAARSPTAGIGRPILGSTSRTTSSCAACRPTTARSRPTIHALARLSAKLLQAMGRELASVHLGVRDRRRAILRDLDRRPGRVVGGECARHGAGDAARLRRLRRLQHPQASRFGLDSRFPLTLRGNDSVEFATPGSRLCALVRSGRDGKDGGMSLRRRPAAPSWPRGAPCPPCPSRSRRDRRAR